jgi:hypothetical protein
VKADDETAGTLGRTNPLARIGGHRIVDDQDVRREAIDELSGRSAHDIASEGERGVGDAPAAAKRDQRTNAERFRQRAAANEVTEAAARAGRRAKQDAQITAAHRDKPR